VPIEVGPAAIPRRQHAALHLLGALGDLRRADVVVELRHLRESAIQRVPVDLELLRGAHRVPLARRDHGVAGARIYLESGTSVLTDADGYFPQTQPTASCFGFAGVMLIERVRYFVANDTDGVPSLYRDRGRGANEIVNRGIEDLQITYDIGQPPAGSPFSATVGPAGCGTNWTP